MLFSRSFSVFWNKKSAGWVQLFVFLTFVVLYLWMFLFWSMYSVIICTGRLSCIMYFATRMFHSMELTYLVNKTGHYKYNRLWEWDWDLGLRYMIRWCLIKPKIYVFINNINQFEMEGGCINNNLTNSNIIKIRLGVLGSLCLVCVKVDLFVL